MGIIQDGFWKVLTEEQAWHVHQSENVELYVLHDDGSESLIYEDEDLAQALCWGESVGIESNDIDKIKHIALL